MNSSTFLLEMEQFFETFLRELQILFSKVTSQAKNV
jgi:hypothetical protein